MEEWNWGKSFRNRSIIANPCDINIKEIINKNKKKRKFRPFAPAIAEEKNGLNINSNPYMSTVENIMEEKRKFIPVAYVDGTRRVQTVSKSINENFYNLINTFINFLVYQYY